MTDKRYKVLFELTHSDGTLIDKCWDEKKPFEFETDDGQIDACLQKCIEQAKVNNLETFLLTASEAFGDYDDEAVHTMDRKDFDPSIALEQDMAVAFDLPNGTEILGYVKDINELEVVVDFNHLLAGQDISFKVQVLDAVEIE